MAKRSTGPEKSRAASTRARSKPAYVYDNTEPDIPRWLPPVVYLVITVLLFPEVFFKGNTLFGHDTLGLSYFARDFYTEFVRTKHAFPLWDPMVLGGLPFLEGMHGDIFYPFSLALFFLHAKSMWAWKMVLHIFLAGIFANLWLRRGMKLRRGPAFFGGLVYMMGADLVSLVTPGGDGKLFVSALAPLVFWLAERAASGRRISDFAAFALGITLIVLTSHMQLAYFCVWGVTLYFFYRVVEIWRADRDGGAAAKLVGMFALAGILGMGAAAIQFLPPLSYLQNWSLRVDKRADPDIAYAEATSYSLHPEEIVSLVVPEFIGTTDKGTYWGRNGLKLNHEYAGVIVLLLLPIVFFRRRMRRAWFFVGLAVFSLIFALGAHTPFFRLFMLVPGVKLFRAPGLIIFLYALSISTLGAMALQRLVEWRGSGGDETKSVTRYLWGAFAATVLLALFSSSGGLMKMWRNMIYDPGALNPGLEAGLEANRAHMDIGFWILVALAAALAAWWAGFRMTKYGPRVAIALLALVAAVDLYRVDRPFVKVTAEQNEIISQVPFFAGTSDEVLSYLQKQKQDPKHVFRVANYVDPNTGNFAYRGISRNTLAIHGLETVGGLHGNEMGRYINLFGEQGTDVFLSLQLMNLANAEYLVFPVKIQPIEPLEEVAVSQRSALYRNKAVWPRAFLVGQAMVLGDTAALAQMKSGAIDLRHTAVVPEAAPELSALQSNPQGTVEWVDRGVNRSKLRITTDRPAMVVISDNYYPAWKATVDGKPATLYRADYTLRGIVIPAGAHDVEMFYSTDHLRMAAVTSIVVMLLLLGAVVGGLVRRRDVTEIAPAP